MLLHPNFQRRMNWRRHFIFALLCFWSVICLFPIYWVAISSLKDVPTFDGPAKFLPFIDFTPSLDAWRFILFEHKDNLVLRFFNSLIVGGASTLITVILAAMVIYAVTRFHKKPTHGGYKLLSFMMATRILPPSVIVIPLYFMAVETHMLDSVLALIAVYAAINLPVALWLLRPIVGDKATDQEEAAQLDGASHFYIFFSVSLPMVKSGLLAVSTIIFLLCWNEYLIATYLTSDHALTLPPWMVGQLSLKEAQTGGGNEEWIHLSAATIVMMLPTLAFAAYFQKIRRGPN